MFDKIKLGLSIALVVAGIYGFYELEKLYPNYVFYRILGLLAVIGVAVGIAVTTKLGGQVVAFSRASAMEMRKTVWPTRSETMQTTLIVVIGVAILGLIIFIIDSILKQIVNALL